MTDDLFDKERTDNLGIENDIRLQFLTEKLKKLKLEPSNSSCNFDDIEGFIYGPFTSRFWLMRKHMN